MTAKNQLIKLAKMQDPEPELYKMSYSGLEWIKEKIDEIIHEENDDQLFSILMRLKSHIMVVEDWVLEQEIKETKGHIVVGEKLLAGFDNIYGVWGVTGATDAIILAKFTDTEELSDFTKKILANPNINSINTHVVLETIKEDLVKWNYLACYDSQPIPSLSPSNPCGSEPTTLKLAYWISPQSKSGG